MRILQLAFGNWFSRAYLIGVGVVAALVIGSLATWDQPDANLAGVWLLFVTMPFSLLLVALAPDAAVGPVVFYLAVTVAALVNATLIGLLVSFAHRRFAHRRLAR